MNRMVPLSWLDVSEEAVIVQLIDNQPPPVFSFYTGFYSARCTDEKSYQYQLFERPDKFNSQNHELSFSLSEAKTDVSKIHAPVHQKILFEIMETTTSLKESALPK